MAPVEDALLRRDSSSGSGGLNAPAWASVFILFGALGGIILLFIAVSLIASRLPTPRFNTPLIIDPEAVRDDRTVVQKLEQLDKSAPAKTYKEWKAEMGGDAKPDELSSAFLVCVICLDSLEDEENIRHLPCSHIYHSSCITRWYLNQHDTCPICKTRYAGVPEGDTPRITSPSRALTRHSNAMRHFPGVTL